MGLQGLRNVMPLSRNRCSPNGSNHLDAPAPPGGGSGLLSAAGVVTSRYRLCTSPTIEITGRQFIRVRLDEPFNVCSLAVVAGLESFGFA
jgi:hypothetical protein